jgi:hypothetical protein
MTAGREAIGLPSLFLTVLLLGGLRIAETTILVPPSPYVLLLGVLLLRVAVRSGALAPGLLLASTRSTLANINGAVVMATLWLAAAQTLALLIPESGVPRLAFSVFFLLLLLNTAAASPDRERLLQSLAVTLGAAYVIKFVVLHGLSAPGASAFKRALLAVVDAATAGALIQEVPHPITAYIALMTIALFLLGVFLLPHRERSFRRELSHGFRTLPPA